MVMPGERCYWNVQEWPLEILQRQSDMDMEHGAHTIHVHFHPKGEKCIEQCFTKEIGNNQEA